MSKCISHWMTGLVLVVTLVLVPVSARAGLCAKCVRKSHIMNMGKCGGCGAATTSGSFSLCPTCSVAQNKCQACSAALSAVSSVVSSAVPPVVSSAVPPVVPPVEPPVVKPVEPPAEPPVVKTTTDVKPEVVTPAVK